MSDCIRFAHNKMYVPPSLKKEWFIRVPQVAHRLHRDGTAGFTFSEMYDLKSMKGVIIIDMTLKKALAFKLEDLMTVSLGKRHLNGIKNAMTVFDIKKLYLEGKFEEMNVKQESKHPVAQAVLDKFNGGNNV